jgi:hypothetical protein
VIVGRDVHVGRERRREPLVVEQQEAVRGGRIGGTGAPGGGFLMSDDTDSPRSGAKAAM